MCTPALLEIRRIPRAPPDTTPGIEGDYRYTDRMRFQRGYGNGGAMGGGNTPGQARTAQRTNPPGGEAAVWYRATIG